MNIEKFTAAQRRAIELEDHRILCVAGPGSGKTTVLAHRIERLLRAGTFPKEIIAISYTNAAATNLEARVQASVSDLSPLGFCGTLHGFCLRMLKRHGGPAGYGERTAILDEAGCRELIESKAKTIGCKAPLDKILKLKARGRPIGPIFDDQELVIVAYMDELRESGLLDFDLILTEFVRLLLTDGAFKEAIATEGFVHLFVDEVQDSALIDWKIFHALEVDNKFLVGDPDQAIFGFRGGRPDLMRENYMSGWSRVVLEENFRCAGKICEAANNLIGHNAQRLKKLTLPAANQDGGTVILFGATENEGDEIAQVMGFLQSQHHLKTEDVAIIARTNAIAAGFRDAAEAMGVTMAATQKSTLPPDWSLARSLIEAIAQPANPTLMYLYLVAHGIARGDSPLASRKIADDMRREANLKMTALTAFHQHEPLTIGGVPKALDLEKICTETRMIIGQMITNLPHGSTIADLALEVARIDRPPPPEPSPGLTVTTIHAAKGREWDVVFIVGFEDQVIPGEAKSADVEEERRLGFVAITRARRSVFISHAQARRENWGRRLLAPHRISRFAKEIKP